MSTIRVILLLAVVCLIGGCGTLGGVLRDTGYILGGASELASDAADNVQLREPARFK